MLRLELCKFTQSVLNIVAVAPRPRSASNAFVGGGRGGGGGSAAGSSGRRRGGDATAAAETASGDADDTTEESCFPLELAEARARATTVPKGLLLPPSQLAPDFARLAAVRNDR